MSYRDLDRAVFLLNALRTRFGVYQDIENGQDVAAIIEHACENVAQGGITLGLAMPLYEDCGWNFDIPAKLFRGMASQEKTVEERGFALREVEVVPCLIFRRGGGHEGRIGYSLHLRSKTKRDFTVSFNGVK